MTFVQWQALDYDLHSMTADTESRIFVNHLSENFLLLQNAQAVNVGTISVLPIVFEDLDRIARPHAIGFDIG